MTNAIKVLLQRQSGFLQLESTIQRVSKISTLILTGSRSR
jgi:hypothetical protein